MENSTDCRTNEGISVGLIDGIIAMARILRKSNLDTYAIQEALKDLQADEDVLYLMNKLEKITYIKYP